MPALSRRHVLKAFGSATLLSILRPFTVGAGFFDGLFGHQARTPTLPITPNEEFYITSYRSPPTIRLSEWALSVKGLVERPQTLTYEQLIEKSAVTHIVTLECVGNTVGGEFIGTAEWTGVPLQALLKESGLSHQAYDVVFRAADGFSDSITVERGVNGTTATTHLTSAPITRFVYDASVHTTALRLAEKRWKARDAGADGLDGGMDIGTISLREGEDTIIRRMLGAPVMLTGYV